MKRLLYSMLIIFFAFFHLCAMKREKVYKINKDGFIDVSFESNEKSTYCCFDDPFFTYVKEKNKTLISNAPDCFKPSFITNGKEARKKLKELGGKECVVLSKNSKKIYCTFMNRGSEFLLVLGGGLPVERWKMLTFTQLFPDYDLLFLDYPGMGSDHEIGVLPFFLPWKWKGLVSWQTINIDFNVSLLGASEEEEIICVVDHFRKKKKYKKVFGLGVCFSAYVFAKALSVRRDLFDKVIFDGVWHSAERVVKTIAKNRLSPFSCVTDLSWFQSMSVKLLEWFAWTNMSMPSIETYLTKLKCPVLFFHSWNDCYCNNDEFRKILNSVKSEKMLCATKNRHGRNHVNDPEAYKEIANKFLKSDGDSCMSFFEMANERNTRI